MYVCMYVYHRCADNLPDLRSVRGLGLLFSIGICNALLDGLGQLKIPGLTFEVWETGNGYVGHVKEANHRGHVQILVREMGIFHDPISKHEDFM